MVRGVTREGSALDLQEVGPAIPIRIQRFHRLQGSSIAAVKQIIRSKRVGRRQAGGVAGGTRIQLCVCDPRIAGFKNSHACRVGNGRCRTGKPGRHQKQDERPECNEKEPKYSSEEGAFGTRRTHINLPFWKLVHDSAGFLTEEEFPHRLYGYNPYNLSINYTLISVRDNALKG
jgi:hypothetical protein